MVGPKAILTKKDGMTNINGLGSLPPIPIINNAAAVLNYFHNATLQGALSKKFKWFTIFFYFYLN